MNARSDERRIGEVVGGKYRVVRFLAAGGMGVVYEAQHTVVKRRFAVKFLRPELAQKRESLARFQREAEAAGALESEHLAAAVDFGIAVDGSPFIIMEYLVGESLGALLEREGPLPLERAVDLVVQACRGIQAAHAAGIVHRDLKPANLFLCRREEGTDLLKVLDFGIAKLEAADQNSADTLTGTVLGTPAYMSPEQARGEKAIDHRADVYALGAILYELLSGRKPHPGDSHHAILHHIATQPAVPLDFVEPPLPAPLAALIERTLASEPAARFASAELFAEAIEPWAKRTANPRRERAPARGLPKALLVGLVGAAVLTVLWLASRSPDETRDASSASPAPGSLSEATPVARGVNATERPLPVVASAESEAAPSPPPAQKPRLPAPPPKTASTLTPARETAPRPETSTSAPPLAFDRQNPYD